MLKIRLARRGKKRQPSYRIVVADVEAPRDGRYVEQIGYYDPMQDPAAYKVEEDRALYWLSVGAKPSDAVERLLEKQGTFARLRRLRDGEEFGALVSEFTGEPYAAGNQQEEATPAHAAESVDEDATLLEQAAELIEDAVDAVADVVEDVTEAVADIVEDEDSDDESTDTDDSGEDDEEAAAA